MSPKALMISVKVTLSLFLLRLRNELLKPHILKHEQCRFNALFLSFLTASLTGWSAVGDESDVSGSPKVNGLCAPVSLRIPAKSQKAAQKQKQQKRQFHLGIMKVWQYLLRGMSDECRYSMSELTGQKSSTLAVEAALTVPCHCNCRSSAETDTTVQSQKLRQIAGTVSYMCTHDSRHFCDFLARSCTCRA